MLFIYEVPTGLKMVGGKKFNIREKSGDFILNEKKIDILKKNQ